MTTTENKKHIEIAPALGIGIILILVAFAGALFYKGMLLAQKEQTQPAVTLNLEAISDDSLASADRTPETIKEELSQIEKQLEEVSAEVSGDDLFGLEELDAELIDFTELDEIFDFEL